MARCAANAYCTCASPCPVAGSSGDGRPVPPLHGLLDRVVAEQVGQVGEHVARRPSTLPPRQRRHRPARARAPASRTASQAARTAPPVMYVCRDADVDPALPTAVSAVAMVTRSHAQLGAGDLRLHGDQALADLGRGGVHQHRRLAADHLQPHPRGGVVVEALGEADVLDADRRSRRRARTPSPWVVLATPPGSSRGSSPDGRRRAARRRTRAQQLGHRRRAVDHLTGRHHRRRSRTALRTRSSTGSRPSAAASLSICDSYAKHACTAPKPRIAPHGGLLV